MQTLEHVSRAADGLRTLPITLRHHEHRDTIQERFQAFHTAHSEIYELLVALARDVKRRGHGRYSMKAIFERARWHYQIEKGDREFVLNNSFTAPYARLIMAQESDLKGFFETREHRCEP